MVLFVYFYLPVYFLKRRGKRHGVGWMGRWGEYGRMWGGETVIRIYCMNFNKTNKEVGAGLMKN